MSSGIFYFKILDKYQKIFYLNIVIDGRFLSLLKIKKES